MSARGASPLRTVSPSPRSRDSLNLSSSEAAAAAPEHHHAGADKEKLQRKSIRKCSGKTIVAMMMASIMCFLLWDTFVTPPEQQWLKKTNVKTFLTWVQLHPYWGLGAFLIAIASCVIFMIPVGTPLTLGAGYIYKGVYGWTIGIVVGTAVSVLGSALGAVSCFLLGRYLMRERVRKWIRKYPLFDAIDVAVSEQGLRIMAMLYLTPVLPLGPVSYMCGTTSMALSSFALAKVASLPLMVFYVYLGAATGTLLSGGSEAEQIEENKTFICIGIVLSAVMIACISHRIRKELDKILERQKRESPTKGQSTRTSSNNTDDVIELGMATTARHRRSVMSTTTSETKESMDVLEIRKGS